MHYIHLSNPHVGVITEVLEPFRHAVYIGYDDSLIEDYETTRGAIRSRVRQDARLWLIENLPLAHRNHPDQRMIVFRSAEDAMLFKLVFG